MQVINFSKNQIRIIDAIVLYRTLPPQIDHTLPYKLKADKAEVDMDKQLSEEERQECLCEIEHQVNTYYGETGAGQFDSLF